MPRDLTAELIDRHRFDKRIRELGEHAKLAEDLAHMIGRATPEDFREAATLMRGAATDLELLVKANLPGCVCPHIQKGHLDYHDYLESCQHHGHLHYLREKLKTDYAAIENRLRAEVRVSFVAAAISGTALLGEDEEAIVKKAIAIADEAIAQIARNT